MASPDLEARLRAISNVSIGLRGDEADVESYHLAFQRRVGQDEIQLFAGRYLDLFQRRDGAWAILRRTGLRLEPDDPAGQPVPATPSTSAPPKPPLRGPVPSTPGARPQPPLRLIPC